MRRPIHLFILLSVHLFISELKAEDTLRLNIWQADSIFLTKNYYLLASSMNIEEKKAQILQSRLYPNPVFTADLNAYDPENKKPFHVGNSGQKAFQLEQLIILGGKRKAQIEMAKTDASIAELEFQDLNQHLKFKLHSSLFALGQQETVLKKYDRQLSLLDDLLDSYKVQAEKGNLALSELVRLKGAYLKLNNDRAELFKDYFNTQADLQKLLQTGLVVQFRFSEEDIAKYVKVMDASELMDIAANNRPDLLIAKLNGKLSEQDLQFQKRSAVPDLAVFGSYDQRSGAFTDQVNIGFSVPLPFWNRNQGNIRSAQYRVQETDYRQRALSNEVDSEIRNGHALYNQTVSEYRKTLDMYDSSFELTINGVTENFRKRNISIIEFIDFFEAYNEVQTELARIKTQLVSSAEELNLLVGKDIYR